LQAMHSRRISGDIYIDTGCNRLMAVIRAIFGQSGRQRSNRIQDA
jgi:hypothetical protein